MAREIRYPPCFQLNERGRSYYLPTRSSVIFRRVLCTCYLVIGLVTVVFGIVNVKYKLLLSSQLVHDTDLTLFSMPVVQGILLISLGTAGIVTTKKNHPGPLLAYWVLFFVNFAIRYIAIWINCGNLSSGTAQRNFCKRWRSENCKNDDTVPGDYASCMSVEQLPNFCDEHVELRYSIDVILTIICCLSIILVAIGTFCDPFQYCTEYRKRETREELVGDVMISVPPLGRSISVPPPVYTAFSSSSEYSRDTETATSLPNLAFEGRLIVRMNDL